MEFIDYLIHLLLIGVGLGLVAMVLYYAKGLAESPRELWILVLYVFVDLTAYGAMSMTLILLLKSDCGLSDMAGGTFIALWSMLISGFTLFVGAFVDILGVKRVLLISIAFYVISRFFISWVTDPVLIFVIGLAPLALAVAIPVPAISVAVKRYTTRTGAALGFGLYYVALNLGLAFGSQIFDWIRNIFAERDGYGNILNENFGMVILGNHFSTYQLLFVFSMLCSFLAFFIALCMRSGVSLAGSKITVKPKSFSMYGDGFASIKGVLIETKNIYLKTFKEKYFLVFIGMLALIVPVRTIYLHFYYTFPDYGIRVLGQGAKIGTIWGVLNAVLVVFLVPLFSFFTKKASSYKMMIIGVFISSLSCFIMAVPAHVLAPLTQSVLGELVFVKWLGMADHLGALTSNPPAPEYWPIIFFIVVYSIGESIWAPRLFQFTAEIAPKGKEGTYIALSILPFFVAKFFVGPMTGWLLNAYTPLDAAGNALSGYPDHYFVWIWIGAVAITTPISLVVLGKWFKRNTIASVS